MQAKHEAALKAVYEELVAAGTLTRAQADALLAFKGPMGHEGFGRGHGPGMGQPPRALRPQPNK